MFLENVDFNITASIICINDTEDKILLINHKKLNKWVQLGGHLEEGDEDLLSCAKREFLEESGYLLNDFIVNNEIFHFDFFKLNNSVDKSYLLDVRFLFKINNISLNKNEESNELRWFDLNGIENLIDDKSLLDSIYKLKKEKP